MAKDAIAFALADVKWLPGSRLKEGVDVVSQCLLRGCVKHPCYSTFQMPNGHDRNWIRLCAAVDGFRARYGKWPSRIRLHPLCLDDLRDMFAPDDFRHLSQSLELIADDSPFIAEDTDGRSYSYGDEGFSETEPDMRASHWLGIEPLPGDHY